MQTAGRPKQVRKATHGTGSEGIGLPDGRDGPASVCGEGGLPLGDKRMERGGCGDG